MGTTYSGLSGKTKEDFGHGDACFVTYMNVYSNAVANPDGIEAIEEDPRQHEVMNGDVFFTGSSETPDEVGLSSVWLWNTANTYLNSFCFGYRPCQEFDSLFLAASLRSPQMRSRISLLAQGISRFNISKKQVMQQPLNYPSLPEQRLIGRFFSTLDSLIAAAERQEALLRRKKQAYLQLMFPQEGETEPRLRFAGFSGEWETRQLGEVAEVHNGRDYKHLQPGNIPVYGTSGYMLSVDDALSWNDDAVGIGRKGTIDKPCILRAPFWTVDTLFFVTPRPSTHLEFLFTLFESVNWKSKDESTGVPSLTKQAIVNTAVKVPDTSEQHQIGVFFTQIDNIIAIAEEQAKALRAMKRAYSQRMFI